VNVSTILSRIEGLILTSDQWLCLLELHGIVPSQTAQHHEVIVANSKWKIGVDSGKYY